MDEMPVELHFTRIVEFPVALAVTFSGTVFGAENKVCANPYAMCFK